MKTIKFFLLSAAALFFATSCIDDFTIHGNGIEATEGRLTTTFNKVKSEGAFDVHITQGNKREVVITAESNILPYIEADINAHTLRIHVRGLHNIKNRLPMQVYVTTPHLDGVVQSGSGIVTTDFFESDDFDAVVSGSGRIETAVNTHSINAIVSGSGTLYLAGDAFDSDFAVSGSGRIEALDFEVRDCDAKISGSGNIWTKVERYLSAAISGSGNVYYHGSPSIETHISGSGKVIPEK